MPKQVYFKFNCITQTSFSERISDKFMRLGQILALGRDIRALAAAPSPSKKSLDGFQANCSRAERGAIVREGEKWVETNKALSNL